MRDRVRDYAILLAVSAILTLPNLGATSLWDVDEGVNAQAAREMRDADTWIVPTFNFQLRTAKPVMLYWLQRASYAAFGVSEWSARLPSVLAGWLAVLLTYELARRMFGRATGVLAGVVFASVLQFGMLSHAATPDATLLLFTMLAMLIFWAGHADGSRRWFVPMAAACGLAMLTKGPVGVALPGLVVCAYFAWNRELGRLLDRRLVWAAIAFLLVAGPWYALVASETRGEWVKVFIGSENVGRFLGTRDGHSGPVWYYIPAIVVMFAPWTAFLAATVWYGVKGSWRPIDPQGVGSAVLVAQASGLCGPNTGQRPVPPNPENLRTEASGEGLSCEVRGHRFLVCWVAAYLVFFSAAATKLPNYIYPLYPALAILTARFLVVWRDGTLVVPRWSMHMGIGTMALVGAVFLGSLIYADERFPGLAACGLIGLIPAGGAVAMWWYLRRGERGGVVATAAVASVAFMALLLAVPPGVIDRQKCPRELVRATGVDDPRRDVRVATFGWFQPSVVFYTGREVQVLNSADSVVEFLTTPTPAYMFVPAPVWDDVAAIVPGPHRVAARHFDFFNNCDVLVITNTPTADVAAR